MSKDRHHQEEIQSSGSIESSGRQDRIDGQDGPAEKSRWEAMWPVIACWYFKMISR